ncbi:MAG: alpha-L-fucosidase [Bacteroidia bacterium]|nr:alpha-L-fucosidase [Bacteroidia bacterium]
MRKKFSLAAILVLASGFAFSQTNIQEIPLPTSAQLRYQQYEQIMFLCLDPCTWQGREYDNHSMPLNRINPVQLNTDQWCEVARSWGARLILFVAKHTGGFCWWNTETSDYGVRNIPWRSGKGDVLADLSESCRKFGLGLGIYVYPGDDNWGAGIGSGGKTGDPAKQEGYNRVFRQQMTEVLTKYGPVQEVWFDGSCIIDVSDILTKYASDAVILQGPMANIRWVGNEDGIAPYPNWYTLKQSDLTTGISTSLHSDPNGDAYAPVEMDVPLLKNGGHKWFWAPGTDNLLLTTDQLMDLYYRSVGRGGVLLLNSTPDTTGLIPASHVKAYMDFGNEIRRRFGQPVKSIKNGGKELILSFDRPTPVNHVILQEDIAKGQRIRKFVVEGMMGGQWKKIGEGSSVGQKRIMNFEPVSVSGLRFTVIESAGTPRITSFSALNVSDVKYNSL